MRLILLITYAILSSLLISAQQRETSIPKITNYPPKVYGYESQNYSIVSDDNDFIYVGNLNGILVFDGTNWSLIDMQGGPSLSKTDNGNIYAGTLKSFGVIIKNPDNSIYFHSISDEFADKFNNINNILNIKSHNEDILIQTEKKLYLWHNDLYLVDYNKKGYKTFKVNNNLYVNKIGYGIFKYNNSNLNLFSDHEIFINNIIESILYFSDNKLLIKLKNKGFYTLENGIVEEFTTDADFFFANTDIRISKKLSENKFIFGTERCGAVILDTNGRMQGNIKKESGLLDDNINDIFIDKKTPLLAVSMNPLPILFLFINSR